ncbi:MAG: transglutaminase domain-containing protein [Actinobacteria bacterium]|nr:transglutaminase domain-containing protein [Actinomycetota bacterium]
MKVPRLALLWLILGWLFVVLYPDPSLLMRSISNIRHPDINAAAVQGIAAGLPDDPRLIEEAVLGRVIPYSYDWQVNSVPWYFPTTSEAVASQRGDCESRALVLASILKAKGIPYQLLMSFDHIWVDYPGKVENALENPGEVLAERVNGHLVWHWPSDFHIGAEIQAQIDMYWAPMPTERRLLLFGGVLFILLVNPLMVARRPRPAFHPTRRGRRPVATGSAPLARQ